MRDCPLTKKINGEDKVRILEDTAKKHLHALTNQQDQENLIDVIVGTLLVFPCM